MVCAATDASGVVRDKSSRRRNWHVPRSVLTRFHCSNESRLAAASQIRFVDTNQVVAKRDLCLARNPIKPRTPNPRIIIPHDEGKGVAVIVKAPSATQLEQTPAKPRLPHKYPPPLVAENQASSEVPTPKVLPVGAKMFAKKFELLVPSNKRPAELSIGYTLSELKPAVSAVTGNNVVPPDTVPIEKVPLPEITKLLAALVVNTPDPLTVLSLGPPT
jgi:hypothetical protein